MRQHSKIKIVLEGIGGAIRIAFTILLSPLLRRWYSRWGATDQEVNRSLPGDGEVPHPKSQIDCAITIKAPVEKVWPWFAQLGCQRGGWYSYDLLDNGGTPSADRIMPEFQSLKVGDMVAAIPNGKFGFPVAVIEPNRVLSLAGTLNTKTGATANPFDPTLTEYFSGDQTFYLERMTPNATRLLFRMRIDWNKTRLNNFVYRSIVEPVSSTMGRKMLSNIKQRAEALSDRRNYRR